MVLATSSFTLNLLVPSQKGGLGTIGESICTTLISHTRDFTAVVINYCRSIGSYAHCMNVEMSTTLEDCVLYRDSKYGVQQPLF
jgi:hypothetical protein